VLAQAGPGIPALGRHAVRVRVRHPGLRLILAHAGICDLGWIWRAARDLPNLFFDTAWWSPSDLLALYALVPPGQVLFASDAPYATPSFAAYMNLRYAQQIGLSSAQIELVFAKQLERIVAGVEPLDGGGPPGTGRLDHDALLERAYAFLLASLGQMFQGVEPTETLALTALACKVGDDAPQAETCAAVVRLLEMRAQAPPDDRPPGFAPGILYVVAAAGIARTPDVPMPPANEPF